MLQLVIQLNMTMYYDYDRVHVASWSLSSIV